MNQYSQENYDRKCQIIRLLDVVTTILYLSFIVLIALLIFTKMTFTAFIWCFLLLYTAFIIFELIIDNLSIKNIYPEIDLKVSKKLKEFHNSLNVVYHPDSKKTEELFDNATSQIINEVYDVTDKMKVPYRLLISYCEVIVATICMVILINKYPIDGVISVFIDIVLPFVIVFNIGKPIDNKYVKSYDLERKKQSIWHHYHGILEMEFAKFKEEYTRVFIDKVAFSIEQHTISETNMRNGLKNVLPELSRFYNIDGLTFELTSIHLIFSYPTSVDYSSVRIVPIGLKSLGINWNVDTDIDHITVGVLICRCLKKILSPAFANHFVWSENFTTDDHLVYYVHKYYGGILEKEGAQWWIRPKNNEVKCLSDTSKMINKLLYT